jgi:hypothetical protein
MKKYLTDSQPTITGWYASIGENLETLVLEGRYEEFSQECVLKNTTGEGDFAQPRYSPHELGTPERGQRNRLVKDESQNTCRLLSPLL